VTNPPVERRLRSSLLALAGCLALGSMAELLLLEHVEKPLQLVPFALCLLLLGTVLAVWAGPSAGRVRALRLVAGLTAAAGLWGSLLHLAGNREFFLETTPRPIVWDTVEAMLTGASPVLAPGVLLVMAASAVAATYRLVPEGTARREGAEAEAAP
jgi:hypothetical protein